MKFSGSVLLGTGLLFAGNSGWVVGMSAVGTLMFVGILAGGFGTLWPPECPYWTGLQEPLVCSCPSSSLYS